MGGTSGNSSWVLDVTVKIGKKNATKFRLMDQGHIIMMRRVWLLGRKEE